MDVFASAFDRLATPTLIIDNAGIVHCDNDALRQLLGHTYVGKHVDAMVAGRTSTLLVDLKSAAGGPGINVQFQDRQKKIVRYACQIKPLHARIGAAFHYMIALHPVEAGNSAFAKLSLELNLAQERNRREKHQRELVEDKLKSLENFSLHTAHDLQAPLRQIKMFLTMLDEDYAHCLPRKGVEIVDQAKSAAARSERLIRDLLDLANTTNKNIKTSLVSLDAAVDAQLENFRMPLLEIDALVQVDRPLGAVEADINLMDQLLQNLIENAIKYRYADRQLTLSMCSQKNADGDLLSLCIQDTGQGFSQSDAERIFEPFIRLGNARAEGSGIGLSACKNICDLHGWRIKAQGSAMNGATFTINFSC